MAKINTYYVYAGYYENFISGHKLPKPYALRDEFKTFDEALDYVWENWEDDDIFFTEDVIDDAIDNGFINDENWENYLMKESKKSARKSIKESNKRKNLKESLSFKESELKVDVTFVYDEDNRSPSVSSEIATDYLYDLDDFKEVCDDLSESQNGYYSIEESRSTDGEYKIWFFTFDDSDDMDGTLTGYVIFNVVLNHNKEIEKFFDTI